MVMYRLRRFLAMGGAVFAALVCAGGCRDAAAPQGRSTAVTGDYSELPLLRETSHPGLQEELAVLLREEATPRQLLSAHRRPTPLPDEENVAAGLIAALPPQVVRAIEERTKALFPRETFQFAPAALEEARAVHRDYSEVRRQARAALERPHCDFDVQYTEGLLADTTFTDTAWAYHRLESLAAAELLAADRPHAALEPLEGMLRMVEHLARTGHPAARIAAVRLRREALLVAQALVRHPLVDRGMLETLRGLIERQLAGWPADADAWIGERAIGLHTYELVRDGHLLSLLSEEELVELRREASLDSIVRAVDRTCDEDQWFYLRAMRKIITACDRPFFDRRAVFIELRRELHERRESDAYPLVADYILLRDLESGHRMQAEDRARCEGWSIALAEALGLPRPTFEANPLTGQPYRVVHREGRVEVSRVLLPEEDRPIVVPLVE